MPEMVSLWLHLLILANNEDKTWHGATIKRGQLLTGRTELAHKVGVSERKIRTCLDRLKSTNEIAIKSTNKYSIITICKYEEYQVREEQDDQQNDQQSANNRPQLKNIYKEKDNNKLLSKKNHSFCQNTKTSKDPQKATLEARRKTFYSSLIEYVSRYGKDLVRAFYDYWSESNQNGTKMRFEMEKTWNTSMRLARWEKNNFQKQTFTTSAAETFQERDARIRAEKREEERNEFLKSQERANDMKKLAQKEWNEVKNTIPDLEDRFKIKQQIENKYNTSINY